MVKAAKDGYGRCVPWDKWTSNGNASNWLHNGDIGDVTAGRAGTERQRRFGERGENGRQPLLFVILTIKKGIYPTVHFGNTGRDEPFRPKYKFPVSMEQYSEQKLLGLLSLLWPKWNGIDNTMSNLKLEYSHCGKQSYKLATNNNFNNLIWIYSLTNQNQLICRFTQASKHQRGCFLHKTYQWAWLHHNEKSGDSTNFCQSLVGFFFFFCWWGYR